VQTLPSATSATFCRLFFLRKLGEIEEASP
jgi:hypothetical protein